MNAISPGKAAPSKVSVDENYMMTAVRARDHLQDLKRVQSIVWGLANSLRAEISEAQEGTDKIDTAEPEAFVENVVWLMGLLVDGAKPLENDLEKVGWKP